MLMLSLILQIILEISMAVAIVTPGQLYEMVNKIVDLYINDSCLVVISSGGYIAANYAPVVYVVPYIQEEQNDDSISTAEANYKMVTIAPVLELGCTGYIIQAENPGRQLRLIEKTFVHVNQRNQRRFIFLPTATRGNEGSIKVQNEVLDSHNFNFESVLLEKSVQYIPDMIFAIPKDEVDHVSLLTHRFTGTAGISNQKMILDTYYVAEKRFELGVSLFPDKVKNLEGRVLKVAMFHYPPYGVVIDDDNPNNNIESGVDGTEWRFAATFAKLHNFSLEELIDNEGSWGHIYENITGVGVTGNLVENKADLGLTALYSWHYESLYLDLSAPFYRSGITCLVPKPCQLPQWMSPIRPFTPVLWATIISMTVVTVIFTKIVSQAESFIRSKESCRMSASEAALTVIAITLLQGLNKEPKGLSWAVLSIILLVVSVLLSTAYGSSLASAMTVARFEAPIDTALELAASGIPWAAAHEAWIFSILNAEEPEMRTLVKNFREMSEMELARHSIEKNDWAFSIERLQGGHFSIQDYLSNKAVEKLHLMRSDIYWEYCVSMLRKSSPFTKWFSQRILEIQASGIPAYWETDVALRYLDVRKQLIVHKAAENLADAGPVKMTVEQVQGTFFILVIGLLVSSLVFIGELAQKKSYLRGKDPRG